MTLAAMLMELPAEKRRAITQALAENAVAVTDLSREVAVLRLEFDRMKPVYDAAMAYVEGWSQPLPFDPRIKLHINLIQAYRKAREEEA